MTLQLKNLSKYQVSATISSIIKENTITKKIIDIDSAQEFDVDEGTAYLEIETNGKIWWKGIVPVSENVCIENENVTHAGKIIPQLTGEKSCAYELSNFISDNIYIILGLIAIILTLLFLRFRK